MSDSKPPLTHGKVAEGQHREYVGGKWDEIGPLQFQYLVSQGLRPEHVFLDIACGSLRGGVHFIPYLNTGNYLGLEKEEELVQAGLVYELGEQRALEKKPEFVISDAFAFRHFSKRPEYALAQSLFTHLKQEHIELCLRNLRHIAKPGCRFYATFFEADTVAANPEESHDHMSFYYAAADMSAFGSKYGWQPTYIGDWGHPRGQRMMLYVAP
ncbi:MAG: hypothetical protein KDD69_05095 [Bdellovibrionales bacterium]|nr:hypothetical protein [Bdellovibrionales bacterium]